MKGLTACTTEAPFGKSSNSETGSTARSRLFLHEKVDERARRGRQAAVRGKDQRKRSGAALRMVQHFDKPPLFDALGTSAFSAQAANVLVVLSDSDRLDLKGGKVFETGFYRAVG